MEVSQRKQATFLRVGGPSFDADQTSAAVIGLRQVLYLHILVLLLALIYQTVRRDWYSLQSLWSYLSPNFPSIACVPAV
jgi:hypothetical protein